MDTHDGVFASEQKPSSQCRLNTLRSMKMHVRYLSCSIGAFSLVPVLPVGDAGERSLSGEALHTPAHQHESFNHLPTIIPLPQAMNYSTLRFPHENGKRRHENCLIACSLSLLLLSLSSSSSFASSLRLSLTPSCTIVTLAQGGQRWGGITRLQSCVHAVYP